jgi:CBS domain-containing protein
VSEDGALLGRLSAAEAARTPRALLGSVTAAEAMTPYGQLETLDPAQMALDALGTMHDRQVQELPVVSGTELQGVLRLSVWRNAVKSSGETLGNMAGAA